MATDKPGIDASMDWLRNQGFTSVKKINHPVDLSVNRNGKRYWIEVKYTEQPESYFGAATITEWECALDNIDSFFFLIANKPNGVDSNSNWRFELIEPKEFMKYSTIVPFKINFNLDLVGERKQPKRRTAIQATEQNLRSSMDYFRILRNE